jgi:hypothetical protein
MYAGNFALAANQRRFISRRVWDGYFSLGGNRTDDHDRFRQH